MKKITKILSLLAFGSAMTMSAQETQKEKVFFGQKIAPEKISHTGHVKCITDEYEKFLQANDPKRLKDHEFEAWLAPLIEEQKMLQQVGSQSGGIIYIPVVVHVIHNGDAYGQNENISDEQVQSQITVMTQDFRRMLGTPGYNTNAVGADTTIEFVLAKVDPNGNPTNGINRVNLCQESWSTSAINSTVKPSTIWDPTQYMNMWSVNFSDGSLLGYAQFPESSLAGMSTAPQNANTDGVVAGYRFFGSSDLATGNFAPPFDKGRTMTHEVGHYLGLRHIWGDGNCSADDFCNDTPNAGAPNYECPVGTDSCAGGGVDMIENYMDYTDDACMNIFTNDQKTRILTVMNNSPRRASLKTSTKDLPIALFANDAEVKIDNYCSGASANPCLGNAHKVLLYNRGTSNLTSATLSYNVNGGANQNYNWSGSISPNKYAVVTLTTTQTTGTFNVSVSGVNGGADQRATNNTASKAFNFGAAVTPDNHEYATVNFRLQRDNYGSETSWSLTNGSGTVLYSGGSYANGTSPALISQTWNLPLNGCYTFTINDSYGDGICCTYGSGYYDIKSPDNSVTLTSGGSFTNSASYSFTNNSAMSTSDFMAANAVVVYPNPVSNELNLKFAEGLSGDFSYSIVNNIGQVVKSAVVTSQEGLKINTSGYSNGVYFIKIEKDGETKTIKFLKN